MRFLPILIVALGAMVITNCQSSPRAPRKLSTLEPRASLAMVPDVAFYVPDPRGLFAVLLRDDDREDRCVGVFLRDCDYCYPDERARIKVPATYETDFASIPTLGLILISQFGWDAEGTVVHDWLCTAGPEGDKVARKKAD